MPPWCYAPLRCPGHTSTGAVDKGMNFTDSLEVIQTTIIQFFISRLFIDPVCKWSPSCRACSTELKASGKESESTRVCLWWGVCRPVHGGVKNSARGLGRSDCLPESLLGASMSQLHPLILSQLSGTTGGERVG